MTNFHLFTWHGFINLILNMINKQENNRGNKANQALFVKIIIRWTYFQQNLEIFKTCSTVDSKKRTGKQECWHTFHILHLTIMEIKKGFSSKTRKNVLKTLLQMAYH